MKEKDSAKTNESEKYWTQAEVANHFRISENCVRNWRNRGLFSYFRAPGSVRVLYLKDEILEFGGKHTTPRNGGDRSPSKPSKGKPGISSNRDWRV